MSTSGFRTAYNSLLCTSWLFEQNYPDNHQVSLHLIMKRKAPPDLRSSPLAALNTAHRGGTACFWQQGQRMVTGSAYDRRARQTWWRSGEEGRCKGQSVRYAYGRKPESKPAPLSSLLGWNHFCCWLNLLSTWKKFFRGVEASNCSSLRRKSESGFYSQQSQRLGRKRESKWSLYSSVQPYQS